MNKEMNAFIAHRTQALATVYLTRRQDVTVVPFNHGHLDLIASVAPNEDDEIRGMLNFGVILWGTGQPLPTVEAADRFANGKWRGKSRQQKDEATFYCPVILLLFSMEDDDGYFAWVTEPSARPESGEPTLSQLERFSFAKLDRTSLDRIVAKVKSWYGSFASELLVAK